MESQNTGLTTFQVFAAEAVAEGKNTLAAEIENHRNGIRALRDEQTGNPGAADVCASQIAGHEAALADALARLSELTGDA